MNNSHIYGNTNPFAPGSNLYNNEYTWDRTHDVNYGSKSGQRAVAAKINNISLNSNNNNNRNPRKKKSKNKSPITNVGYYNRSGKYINKNPFAAGGNVTLESGNQGYLSNNYSVDAGGGEQKRKAKRPPGVSSVPTSVQKVRKNIRKVRQNHKNSKKKQQIGGRKRRRRRKTHRRRKTKRRHRRNIKHNTRSNRRRRRRKGGNN